MPRGSYAPLLTPVENPVAGRVPARWRWLFVPFGHAMLAFAFMAALWLEPLREAAAPEHLLGKTDAILWIAKEALFQGGVLLVLTTIFLWAVPRILPRHAAYIAITSAVSWYLVELAACYLSGPTSNNGERLDRTVMTYIVVLLLCSVIIRRMGRNVA
jgi:hypothetical protein